MILSEEKLKEKKDRISKANNIVDLISNYYNLDIRKRTRTRNVLLKRQVAIYLINKSVSRIRLSEIACLFPNSKGKPMNHATILHSVNLIEDLKRFDKEINFMIDNFEEQAKEIGLYKTEEILHLKEVKKCYNMIKELTIKEVKEVNDYLTKNFN